MDRHTIDNQHIIARYLAGQLDAVDSAAFEAHYAKNPDVVREIERTLRLKEGLAVLEEKGELDALLHRRTYWRPAMGLAAGIAVLVVGVWLWIGQMTVAPIVATVAALTDTQGKPLHIASTHMLVRTRGPAQIVEIPLPQQRSAIELQMIPSSRPESGRYRVLLGQLDAANAVAPVAETHATANSADGFVTTYLDSGRLARTRYVIELVPEGAAPGTPSDRFVVEVR
jgi:hypothetical protein